MIVLELDITVCLHGQFLSSLTASRSVCHFWHNVWFYVQIISNTLLKKWLAQGLFLLKIKYENFPPDRQEMITFEFSFPTFRLKNQKSYIGSVMEMENNGGEECAIKILGAGTGVTRFSHMMTHHLTTLRWLAEMFVKFKFWSVIGRSVGKI